MKTRLALPHEAEECWNVRNLAIREGCKPSYSATVIEAWTPEAMPENYRTVIDENPFFVVDLPDVGLVATGYLDLSCGSVEAVFTSPDYFGQGWASLIIKAIKHEALQRGLRELTLSSTPNAQTFYEKHGFVFIRENSCLSRLAQTDLRCIDMSLKLEP